MTDTRTPSPPSPAVDGSELLALADRIDRARNQDCFDEPFIPEMKLTERDAIIAALRATATPVGGDLTAVSMAADHVVSRVVEWDDRTSPDYFPEALLITPSELHRELMRFAEDICTRSPVGGDRERIAFEFYRFLYPNRWDWPFERQWEDFQGCRGSITWRQCERSADAILALSPLGAGVGREAIIEECAKIAETVYSRMFPKPSNRITAENAGHIAAQDIRALSSKEAKP